MYSIKPIILLTVLLISGCSTGVRQQPVSEEEISVGGDLNVSAEEKHLYRQAITAVNAGELEQAERLLKEFSQRKPRLAGPLANLGLVYFKQEKLELAEKTLQQALQKNPRQAHALNLLGQIAYANGDAGKAEDYYKRAIAIKDDYAIAHYNLALLYDILFQDIQKAVIHYRRYMQLTGNSDSETGNWLEQLENSLKGI